MAALEKAFELSVLIEAVDRFTGPMKRVEAQMGMSQAKIDKITRSMKTMGATSKDIDRINSSLNKLNDMRQLDQLTQDLENIGASRADIDMISQGFESMAAQERNIAKLEKTMSRFKKTALVGAGMTVGGIVGADFLTKALRQAGEFQTQLVTIQDITGATNKQIQNLGNGIMNTSTKVTRFNDMELTGFAKQLATGGFNNVADVQKLLLPVSQFAEAQVYEGKNSDPQQAVNQAIQMAHLFKQYKPKQFAGFLDTFNKYSNMQPGDSSELYQTLTYLAPVASRQMKMSNQDVMALAAVANRVGLTGSHGGTNAADMILRLIPGIFGGTSGKQLAAMQQMGLVDSKGKSVFFKNGHITNLNNMLNALIGASKKLTPEQMAYDYKQIFGMQGGRAASILSDPTTIEQLQKMQQQLHHTKSMQQIQKDITNTPEGQLNLLKSNAMTAELRFAQTLGPMLNPILERLNRMLSSFLKLEQQHPQLMKLAGVFAVMATGLLLTAGPLTSVIGLLGMFGTALRIKNAAGELNFFGKALKGIFVSLPKGTGKGLWKLLDVKNFSGIGKAFGGLFRGMGKGDTFGPIFRNFARLGTSFKTLRAEWGTFGAIMKIIPRGFGSVGSSALHLIKEFSGFNAIRKFGREFLDLGKAARFLIRDWGLFGGTLKILTRTLGIFGRFALRITNITKLWRGAQLALNFVMDMNPIGAIILAITALVGIVILLVTHWKQVVNWCQRAWKWFQNLHGPVKILVAVLGGIPLAIIAIIANWKKVMAFMKNVGKQAEDWGRMIVSGLWQGILALGGWFKNKIGGWVSSHITGPFKRLLGIHSPSTVFAENGKFIVQGLSQGIDQNIQLLRKSASAMAQTAKQYGMSSPVAGGRYNPVAGAGTSAGSYTDQSRIEFHEGSIVIQAAAGTDAKALAKQVIKEMGRQLRNEGYRSGSKPANAW